MSSISRDLASSFPPVAASPLSLLPQRVEPAAGSKSTVGYRQSAAHAKSDISFYSFQTDQGSFAKIANRHGSAPRPGARAVKRLRSARGHLAAPQGRIELLADDAPAHQYGYLAAGSEKASAVFFARIGLLFGGTGVSSIADQFYGYGRTQFGTRDHATVQRDERLYAKSFRRRSLPLKLKNAVPKRSRNGIFIAENQAVLILLRFQYFQFHST